MPPSPRARAAAGAPSSPADGSGDAWIDAQGVSLRLRWYEPSGGVPAAPAVLVLHGLVTGVDPLRQARRGIDPFARLAAAGAPVAALDWPGHGRSGGRRGWLDYPGAMRAVSAAISAAQERWHRPVVLLGVGLGGTLALYGGIEDRRVSAVVAQSPIDLRDVRAASARLPAQALLPTAARARRWLDGRVDGLPVPVGLLLDRAALSEHRRTALRLWRHPQAVRRYPLGALGELLLEPADKPDVAAARAPTLLVAGTADRTTPATMLRRVAGRLTAPHATWQLPGGSHQLLLDHPDALCAAVASFLRRRVR